MENILIEYLNIFPFFKAIKMMKDLIPNLNNLESLNTFLSQLYEIVNINESGKLSFKY